MKSFGYYILLALVLSCKTKKEDKPLPIEKKIAPKEFSTDEIFRVNYNVTDLKNYKDSSQFIGRIIVTKRFNKILLIELTEFGNSILLCVKQPFTYPYEQNIDSFHSKTFNQLCYDYSGQESIKIKEAFTKYSTNEIKNIVICPGCLDPQPYEIEIFDHGKYSSLKGDIISKEDFNFVSYIMNKTKINYKDFKIRY